MSGSNYPDQTFCHPFSEEVEHGDPAFATGGTQAGEDRMGISPLVGVVASTDLAGDDPRTEALLGGVVGWLNAIMVEEGEESSPMLGQMPGHASGVVIGIADVLSQKGIEPRLKRRRSLSVAGLIGLSSRASQRQRLSEAIVVTSVRSDHVSSRGPCGRAAAEALDAVR